MTFPSILGISARFRTGSLTYLDQGASLPEPLQEGQKSGSFHVQELTNQLHQVIIAAYLAVTVGVRNEVVIVTLPSRSTPLRAHKIFLETLFL